MINSTLKIRIMAVFGSAVLIQLFACTPKIVVLDRQTILEQESAGEWPEIESQLYQNSSSLGPIPFPTTPLSPQKERLYHVLNGEGVSEE